MKKSAAKNDDIIEKYCDSGGFLFFARPTKDRDYKIVFVKREDDYVLATSSGEEFPISYETLDKVRDVLSGNMTGLTEYEENFFKKFSYEHLLKTMAKESAFRCLENEGVDVSNSNLMILADQIFNPKFMMPLREEYSSEEKQAIKKREQEIKDFIKQNYGVEVPVNESTITNLIIKLTSDKDREKKRFLKNIKKK